MLPIETRVRTWMEERVEENPDISMTQLAEEAVDEFDLDDELLDEDSWVFDLAFEVTEWYTEQEFDEEDWD